MTARPSPGAQARHERTTPRRERPPDMGNLRGSVLMVLAMAGFALEDMFIKRLAETMPVGQIIAVIGLGGAVIFAAIARGQGRHLITRDLLARPVILRNLGEMAGTMCFVTAIALTPLSSASAILQATPLVVTLGAAVFLGAPVGWRRWLAILVGFAGVLMVIRPGLAGFAPASLFAVGAVIGLAVRDLATRAVPAAISSMQLSAYAFATLVPTGAILMALGGAPVALGAGEMRDRGAGAFVRCGGLLCHCRGDAGGRGGSGDAVSLCAACLCADHRGHGLWRAARFLDTDGRGRDRGLGALYADARGAAGAAAAGPQISLSAAQNRARVRREALSSGRLP